MDGASVAGAPAPVADDEPPSSWTRLQKSPPRRPRGTSGGQSEEPRPHGAGALICAARRAESWGKEGGWLRGRRVYDFTRGLRMREFASRAEARRLAR